MGINEFLKIVVLWLYIMVIMYKYNPIGLKGRYNMAKKYKDFTVEEKQEYKEKRDAYWKKREEAAYNAYEQLKGGSWKSSKLHLKSCHCLTPWLKHLEL